MSLGEYTRDGNYQYKILPFTTMNRIGNGNVLIIAMPVTEKEADSFSKNSILKKYDIKIYPSSVIAMGDPKETTPQLLTAMVGEENHRMPIGYDYERREAPTYKVSSGNIVKTCDTSKINYFNYHVSLLGNPSNVIVFRINLDELRKSKLYEKLIDLMSKKPDYANICG